MPIYTHLYIKEQALSLVEEYGVTIPPVDVREIARNLSIEIIEMSSDVGFYGMLTRYESDFYIVINKAMSETKKRFAIAHEIGHYILHDRDLKYQGRPDTEYCHREADVFALELCIPTPIIKQEAFNYLNDHRFLAKIFDISEPLMVKKMEELRLIRKGKFNWVYANQSSV